VAGSRLQKRASSRSPPSCAATAMRLAVHLQGWVVLPAVTTWDGGEGMEHLFTRKVLVANGGPLLGTERRWM
jgi:hypothetical protein